MKDRLLKIAEYKGVSIRNFEEICELKRGNISNMGENSEIGSEKLSKIIVKNPEINPNWLLTGEGSMFKESSSCCAPPAPSPTQEAVIAALRSQIDSLTAQIREKDAQINQLLAILAK